MQKKAFTLLEMIFVVVISGVLAMGSFKAMQALYIRSAKANAITDMTLRSQIVLDQIGVMLYNRVPNSVIGSSPGCEAITDVTTTHHVLEWLGTMDDELINRDYDGFVDIEKSDKSNNTLDTPKISLADNPDINLIFSGAFDDGSLSVKACEGAFGFHNSNNDLSYDVTLKSDKIEITDSVQPKNIYEKYYLTKTAYAITRGDELSQSDLENNCNSGNYKFPTDVNFTTTLFLFYGYQPYQGETYCGDSSGTRDGNVSILAENVIGFEALYENDAIRLKLDMNKDIRGSSSVHISKQKVVF